LLHYYIEKEEKSYPLFHLVYTHTLYRELRHELQGDRQLIFYNDRMFINKECNGVGIVFYFCHYIAHCGAIERKMWEMEGSDGEIGCVSHAHGPPNIWVGNMRFSEKYFIFLTLGLITSL